MAVYAGIQVKGLGIVETKMEKERGTSNRNGDHVVWVASLWCWSLGFGLGVYGLIFGSRTTWLSVLRFVDLG